MRVQRPPHARDFQSLAGLYRPLDEREPAASSGGRPGQRGVSNPSLAPGWILPGLLAAALLLAGCSAPAGPGNTGNAPGGAPPSAPPAVMGELVLPETPPVPLSVIPSREPDRPLTVGVSLLTRSHDFYKDLEAAIREEAPKLRITAEIQSAEFDAATQLRQVQTFLSRNVDALILCPVNSDASGTAVKLANEQKVPVFTADIASKVGDVVCHVASNNEQGGMLVGEYLAKRMDGKGDVAIIDFPTVTSVQERVRGFERAIAKFPGIKIVARPVPEQPQQAKAFPKAQDLLQSRPTVKGIFGINDDCALGALQAVEAARRDDVAIVGFDATPQAAERIRQGGALKADAMQFPKIIGATVVSAVARQAIGEAVPRSVPIPTGLVTRKE